MNQLSLPAYTFIGDDALKEAQSRIRECGQHALIVTGPHVAHSKMMEEVVDCLQRSQIDYQIYNGITGEPTDEMIDKGVDIYRGGKCDFVVGLGGGSPIDAAKAIAVMSEFKGNISDLMGVEIVGDYPPVVAIPTTAGTGSEATKFTVITESRNNIKMLLKGECIVPKIAVINPAFTADMPKGVTASTGLDALTHAIEAYTSVKATEQTDDYAIKAVRRIMRYLPSSYCNGDREAREQMAVAAYEAGICINNSSVTIVHGMSRPIGALFHIPHGKSNALLLDTCLRFARDGACERFANLGREIGCALADESDENAAEKFLSAVEDLLKICEISTLREAGVDEGAFTRMIGKMSRDAMASGSPANTRKTVTEEDCRRLYQELIQK